MDETFELEKFENLKLEFQDLSDELFIAFSNFIIENLHPAKKIEEKKNKLSEKKSIKCLSLEILISSMRKIVEEDYRRVDKERKAQKWDFKYFLTFDNYDDKTLTIYNRLHPKKIEVGYLVYPVLSIRKYGDCYYHWKH